MFSHKSSCRQGICVYLSFNTLRPRRNEQHFADDIFKRIFFYGNVWISIKISLKFVPKGPIYNIPALVQIMAWRRPGAKPLSEPRLELSEPMMDSLPTHICVTRPQWVKLKCCDMLTCVFLQQMHLVCMLKRLLPVCHHPLNATTFQHTFMQTWALF